MPALIGSRRVLLNRSSPSIRAGDEFTAADGTLITDLTPPWTKNAGLSNNTTAPSIDSGRVHNENAATVSVYTRSDLVLTSPNYRVEADVVALSLVNGAGVIGRIVGSTYYLLQYNGGVGWRLFRTGVQLGSTIAVALTLGQTYRAALVMDGSQISAEIDGERLITAVDATITGVGSAGIRFQSAATSTTGIHLSSWRAVQ